MHFRLFKDSSSKQEVTVPVWLLGRRKQERSQTLIACFRKKRGKDHFWKNREILTYFSIQQNNSVRHSSLILGCSYLCFDTFVSKDANKKILYKTFTESPWFLFAKYKCIWGRSTEARSRPGVWSEDNFLPLVFLQEWGTINSVLGLDSEIGGTGNSTPSLASPQPHFS